MRGWETVTQFTDQLFGHLRRAEQRKWANAYIQGLLDTPGKKSIRRLAAVACDSTAASHALHQFVNESPWEWTPACTRLREWVERRSRPRAWTIAPVVLPKRGDKSCGVHRRFLPHIGRTVNCQVGTAVFLSSEAGEFPVGWTLLLPAQWARSPHREKARVPREIASSPEGVVLRMVDQVLRGSPHEDLPVIVDLEGYMDTRRLVDNLNGQGRDFIVAIPESFPLLHVGPSARVPRTSEAAPGGNPARERSRVPVGGTDRARIHHGPVRMPGAPTSGPRTPPLRIIERPRSPGTGTSWITNMAHTPVGDLLWYTERHTATRETVGLLERRFGLRDFEGRSFPGWHHHMTLVSAAFAYSRLAVDLRRSALRVGSDRVPGGGGATGPPASAPCPVETPAAPDHLLAV